MSKYNTGLLISELRERTALEREAISDLSNIDESSLRRIENEKQLPKQKTLAKIIESIDLPIEGFVYPLLDELPMEVLLLCDRLTQTLDMEDTITAEKVLNQLKEIPNLETGVITQFIISSTARLWELQGKPIDEILPLIEEGMTETFASYKDDADITTKVLVLEEPELMHTKARLLAKSGKVDDAIVILEKMVNNLVKIPSADREKERQFAALIFSLSKFLILNGDYEKVLSFCELGAEYSAARKYGYLNPDFELCKATALRKLGRVSECKAPLQYAYFGFILLGDIAKAKELLVNAKKDFGIQFPTYGVEKMNYLNQHRVLYNRGEAVQCFSFGTMLRALRERAGLSLEQLSQGLCSKQTLLRVENDETIENYFTIEAVMQRLGRDINLYKNFFLSKNDFVQLQLRDRIRMLVIEQRFDTAAALLSTLETLKYNAQNNALRQFIEMTRVLIYANKCGEPSPTLPIMLLEALHITCPQFDESDIEKYHLTYNEIVLINQYAGYFGDTDNPERSADIYYRLRRNINGKYVDEIEKARMYSTVLFNCSSSQGRAGRLSESLETITDGENFERNRGRIIDLPGFIFNRGYCLLLQSRKYESLPYFALAYYGASLFAKYGQESYLPTIQRIVEKNLELVFD